MALDIAGVALVIAAIGGAGGMVTAIGNYVLARNAAIKKDAKTVYDEAERNGARRAQLDMLQALADKSDVVHKLVNDRSEQQDARIVALSNVISKGATPPQMLAEDAAPGQVTQDGDVVSVGKVETEP